MRDKDTNLNMYTDHIFVKCRLDALLLQGFHFGGRGGGPSPVGFIGRGGGGGVVWVTVDDLLGRGLCWPWWR